VAQLVVALVVAAIPDGFTGFFSLTYPSGRTTALGSTQPVTEMSTRNISWGVGLPVHMAGNLTTFMYQLS
jgi:hypothetical protein